MENFGVTYDPPRDVNVGRGTAITPSEYAERAAIDAIPEDFDTTVEFFDESAHQLKPQAPPPAISSPRKPRRRSSVAAESDSVITTDDIRPDWEHKLASAKSRLARKPLLPVPSMHPISLSTIQPHRPIMSPIRIRATSLRLKIA